MKIKKIEYKLSTTDKLNCHKCGNSIDGKEGCINMSFERTRGYFPLGDRSMLLICWNCFSQVIQEVNKARKTRIEDYQRLLKRRIIMNLK